MSREQEDINSSNEDPDDINNEDEVDSSFTSLSTFLAEQHPIHTTELILDNHSIPRMELLLVNRPSLSQFIHLVHLSLSEVGLYSLEGFPCLMRLKRLNLSHNKLTGGLDPLVEAKLDILEELDIGGNPLPIEALTVLKKLKELKHLNIKECKLTLNTKDYFQKILEFLPNLATLDDEEVGSEEDEESELSERRPSKGRKGSKGNRGKQGKKGKGVFRTYGKHPYSNPGQEYEDEEEEEEEREEDTEDEIEDEFYHQVRGKYQHRHESAKLDGLEEDEEEGEEEDEDEEEPEQEQDSHEEYFEEDEEEEEDYFLQQDLGINSTNMDSLNDLYKAPNIVALSPISVQLQQEYLVSPPDEIQSHSTPSLKRSIDESNNINSGFKRPKTPSMDVTSSFQSWIDTSIDDGFSEFVNDKTSK